MIIQSESKEAATEPQETRRRTLPTNFSQVRHQLSWTERANIRFIKATFKRPWVNHVLFELQRVVGAGWIYQCVRQLIHIEGADRLPPLDGHQPLLFAANHRSFFDMFVINTVAFRLGLRQRMLFPVRSGFFYDHPAGFWVNGMMSFWSMYPPVFRDRKRLRLNQVAFHELGVALSGGRSAGIHPEGTRNLDPDPYKLLPAHSGIGRLIHGSEVTVIPCFINGLGNSVVHQVWDNFTGRGDPIILVFGEAIKLDAMREEPANVGTYRKITEMVMDGITRAGEEERRCRQTLAHGSEASVSRG